MKNRYLNLKNRYIYFDEFQERIIKLASQIKKNKNIKDIFGIPRGGLIPAVCLSHLTKKPLTANPLPKSTAIIDDVIDNGNMRNSFKEFKYFYALVNKQKEKISDWVIFWWEEF
jgi:hypothetical protein